MPRSMNCPNREKHRWSFQMTRLYVRRTEGGKRKWSPVGWHCDPESSTWGDHGCGHIMMELVKEEADG